MHVPDLFGNGCLLIRKGCTSTGAGMPFGMELAAALLTFAILVPGTSLAQAVDVILDNTNSFTGTIEPGVTVVRPPNSGPLYFAGALISYVNEPVCNGSSFTDEDFYGGPNRVGRPFTECIINSEVPFRLTATGSGNTYDVFLTFWNIADVDLIGTPPNTNAPSAALSLTLSQPPPVPFGPWGPVGLVVAGLLVGVRALMHRVAD